MKTLYSLLPIYFIINLIFISTLSAQDIVVSEYFNKNSGPATEWTELLVIKDNLNLKGCVLRDNSTSDSINQWQAGVRFKNISFWEHLRAGTIIVINHRDTLIRDDNADDGYIELCALDSNFFVKVVYTGEIWQWSIRALNIAKDKDILQIIDANGNHIHSLSHMAQPRGDYLEIDGPKVNHQASIFDSSSVSVVPGTGLPSYFSGSGTNHTNNSSAYITKGYPNSSENSTNENQLYWRQLREPDWYAPNLKSNVSKNYVKLSWNKCDDSYPQDGVQGYIIIRYFNNGNVIFSSPNDGTDYDIGDSIGSGKVVNIISRSQITECNDYFNFQCENSYYYRIYAFRYTGTGYNVYDGRGRSYNTTEYAQKLVVKKMDPEPYLNFRNDTINICKGDNFWLMVKFDLSYKNIDWYKNDTLVKSGLDTIMIIDQQGNYYVHITDTNNCEDFSRNVNLHLVDSNLIDIYYQNNLITQDTLIRICQFDNDLKLKTKGVEYYKWFRNDSFIIQTNDSFFIPTQEGKYYCIGYNHNILCSDTSLKIEIKKYNINFEIEPDSIIYELTKDEFSQEKTISIKNNSNDTLYFTDIELPAEFIITQPDNPLKISPETQQNYKIRFTPNSSGANDFKIVFKSNCNYYDTVYIHTIKHSNMLKTDVTSVDFERILLCEIDSVTKVIQLKNESLTKIEVLKPIIEKPFELNYPDFPLEIELQSIINCKLSINTSSTGTYIDTLIFPFKYNNLYDSIRVILKAEIVLPEIEFYNNIDFPSIENCNSYSDTTIIVRNKGLVDVFINNQFSDSRIKITNQLPVTIEAGEEDTINIRFQPEGFGFYSINDTLRVKPCDLNLPVTFFGEKQDYNMSFNKYEINFGKQVLCDNEVFEDSLTISIDKYLNSDIIVKSISISENYEINLSEAQIFNNNQTINVRYKAIKGGIINDSIIIITEPCDKEYIIYLKGEIVTPKYSVEPSKLDFYISEDIQENTKSFIIKNNGKTEININSIENVNHPFYINQVINYPIIIEPDNEYSIIIKYIPDNISIDSNTIKICSNYPCPRIDTLIFSGKSERLSPKKILLSAIDNFDAKPGDTVSIPFYLKTLSEYPLNQIGIKEINTLLHYNPTILLPLSIDTTEEDEIKENINLLSWEIISQGKIKIDIEFENPELLTDNEIFIFNAITFLGDKSYSDVFLDSIDITSKYLLDVETNPIKVNIFGCVIDSRSIQPIEDTLFSLKSDLIQNQNINISYFVNSNEEKIEVLLFDNLGNELTKIIDGYMKRGYYSLEFEHENLINGIYFIQYRHSNILITKKILVIKS